MKKQYVFLLLSLIGFNFLNAQFCPPTGFTTGSTVYFVYDSGTSLCGTRPGTITIDGSTFTLVSCTDTLSTYELDSGGSPVANLYMFTADFGGTIGECSYNDGTLPVDKIDIINEASFRVYPNPISADNNILKVGFAINTTGKLNISDITGKLILKDVIYNSNSKEIDVAGLSKGIYMLTLITESFFITRKFVKAN